MKPVLLLPCVLFMFGCSQTVQPTPKQSHKTVKPAKKKAENFAEGKVALSPSHSTKIVSIKLPALDPQSTKTGYQLTVWNKGRKKALIQTDPKGLPDMVDYRSPAYWANIKALDGANGVWVQPGKKTIIQDSYRYFAEQGSSKATKIDLVVSASFRRGK